jgi:hypothetical protein
VKVIHIDQLQRNVLCRTLGQRESSHPDVIWWFFFYTDFAVNVTEKAVLSSVPVQLVLLALKIRIRGK